MLSVFITPWTNPTSIHRATSDGLGGRRPRRRSARYGSLGVGRCRVVAGDRVVGEAAQQVEVAVRGGVLERADAQVAARPPGPAPRPGSSVVAGDRLAGGDDGERPRGRDAERVHRLADHVLAQHRPDRGLAVAAAGERRAARALQVEVAPAPVGVDELAEQQRPAVAEPRRVAAELVAGVGLRDRRGAVGDAWCRPAAPTPSGVRSPSGSRPSSTASGSLSASSRGRGRRLGLPRHGHARPARGRSGPAGRRGPG